MSKISQICCQVEDLIQHEGSGWRLAYNSSRQYFPVIIGGDGWGVELAHTEWTSLVSVIEDLICQHNSIKDQLMPDELIALEIERDPWWACLEGNQETWSLQLVLEGNDVSSSRGFEAFWPVPAAQAITYAMRTMWDSGQH